MAELSYYIGLYIVDTGFGSFIIILQDIVQTTCIATFLM